MIRLDRLLIQLRAGLQVTMETFEFLRGHTRVTDLTGPCRLLLLLAGPVRRLRVRVLSQHGGVRDGARGLGHVVPGATFCAHAPYALSYRSRRIRTDSTARS